MREPSGTVVFMGAGASKAFGLPLTDEILPEIIRRLRPDTTRALFKGPRRERLSNDLRRAFTALYPGIDLDRPTVDLPSITNVLSLLDHLVLHQYPAGLRFTRPMLVQARRLLERAMMEVLVNSDFSGVTEQLEHKQDYGPELREVVLSFEHEMTEPQRETLQKFLAWLSAKREDGPVTLITTNYDVAVETALFRSPAIGLDKVSSLIDFGFDWRDPYAETMIARPENPCISLYKLHGSLNWLRCDLCGQLYVNPLEVIAYLSFTERQGWANTCDCGSWPLAHLIVAPSMVRDVRDPHLLNVWRCATEALRIAKEWVIIGYSLPAEDLAIRSMLLRAFSARGLQKSPGPLGGRASKPGPRVTIVQRGDGARPAYGAMFQTFNYLEGGLEELVSLPE